MKILATALIIVASIFSLPAGDMPGDIKKYYDRANFITSFSTRPERNLLVGEWKKNRGDISHLKGRASKILNYIQLNAELVGHFSPNMPVIGPSLKMGVGNYPGLLKIMDFKRKGNTVVLKIQSFSLSQKQNIKLVSQYDSVSGKESKLPTLEERFAMGSSNSPSIIYHEWTKHRSGWKKNVADTILLVD